MSTPLALLFVAAAVIVAVCILQSTKKRVVTIEEIWAQSLIFSRSSSICGNCGNGGYGVPLRAENDPTCCIHCGSIWVYGWLIYDAHEPTQAEDDAQAAIIAATYSVKLLGCGSGDLEHLSGKPRIWRRYANGNHIEIAA